MSLVSPEVHGFYPTTYTDGSGLGDVESDPNLWWGVVSVNQSGYFKDVTTKKKQWEWAGFFDANDTATCLTTKYTSVTQSFSHPSIAPACFNVTYTISWDDSQCAYVTSCTGCEQFDQFQLNTWFKCPGSTDTYSGANSPSLAYRSCRDETTGGTSSVISAGFNSNDGQYLGSEYASGTWEVVDDTATYHDKLDTTPKELTSGVSSWVLFRRRAFDTAYSPSGDGALISTSDCGSSNDPIPLNAIWGENGVFSSAEALAQGEPFKIGSDTNRVPEQFGLIDIPSFVGEFGIEVQAYNISGSELRFDLEFKYLTVNPATFAAVQDVSQTRSIMLLDQQDALEKFSFPVINDLSEYVQDLSCEAVNFERKVGTEWVPIDKPPQSELLFTHRNLWGEDRGGGSAGFVDYDCETSSIAQGCNIGFGNVPAYNTQDESETKNYLYSDTGASVNVITESSNFKSTGAGVWTTGIETPDYTYWPYENEFDGDQFNRSTSFQKVLNGQTITAAPLNHSVISYEPIAVGVRIGTTEYNGIPQAPAP